MMNQEMYEIKLEDYRYPRYTSAIRAYYGTMEDIINLMAYLSDNDCTRTRYRETIEAAEYYDQDPEIKHNVAGQLFPVLTQVVEVARFEIQFSTKNWSYTAHNGAVYPCCAENVYACQSLIRTEEGYQRCLRASASGLSICRASLGWICPNDAIMGFPGMVTWDGKHHTMNMSVPVAHYSFEQQDRAFADVTDINSIDLSVIVGDILAEG